MTMLERNTKGFVTRRGPFFGPGGVPIVPKAELAAQTVTSFNDLGQWVEKRFEDLDGNMVPAQDSGASIIRRVLGKNSLERSWMAFDEQSAPTMTTLGYARYDIEYDEKGREVQRTCFDSLSRPTLDRRGVVKEVTKWDNRNRKIERQFFGLAGEPVISAGDGFHQVRWSRGDFGRVVDEAYFGSDELPMNHPDLQYARRTIVYDQRGNEAEVRFFGHDGRPTPMQPGGGVVWLQTFDEYGNRTVLDLRDGEDQPLLGCTRIEEKWVGPVPIWRACFDFGGYPANLPGEDHHELIGTFDALNRIVAEVYLDGDGKSVWSSKGFARLEKSYQGPFPLAVEVRYYDESGRPVEVDGIARYVAYVDDLGRNVGGAIFDDQNQPTYARYPYSSWEITLDRHGRDIERMTYNVDGKPGSKDSSHVKSRFRYDSRGNIVEKWAEDELGNPVLTFFGWAHAAYVFDVAGNNIAWTQYGVDGLPTFGASGYATKRMEYNAVGMLTGEAGFGIEGEPVVSTYGYHSWKAIFDDYWREKERRYFGIDDEPVLFEETFHALLIHYDEGGRVDEKSWLGVHDELTPGPDGPARITWRYDATGHLEEHAGWGPDGRSSQLPEGYAKFEATYDSRGRLVSEKRHN
ncbi:MAG: hypothetical protein HN348_03435 [Proteobacteria bacterium]|nr:hypothetical protein [Pseudomonadota bacterium]